jgi:hypothetical protein
MIEEEIDVEGLTPDFERHLAADEGEPAAKLQEKVTKFLCRLATTTGTPSMSGLP